MLLLGEEVEWVQCDTCENWYHLVCVGISAHEANSADEYVCPYCKPPIVVKIKQEENTDITEPEIIPQLQNEVSKISDLNVIAEVAHKLIEDAAEHSRRSPVDVEIDNIGSVPPQLSETDQVLLNETNNDSSLNTAPRVSAQNTPDLNSLICLANVSQNLDVAHIRCNNDEVGNREVVEPVESVVTMEICTDTQDTDVVIVEPDNLMKEKANIRTEEERSEEITCIKSDAIL